MGQSIVFLYWLAFEWFDIQYATLARRGEARPCPVLPLNAFGFLAVSLVQWRAPSPGNLYLLFVLAATADLTSSIIRFVLLPTEGDP